MRPIDEDSLIDELAREPMNTRTYLRANELVLEEPTVKAIPIPDGATNGDVIKVMFPNLKVEDNGGSIYLHYPNGGWIVIDKDWWNAPYKGVK